MATTTTMAAALLLILSAAPPAEASSSNHHIIMLTSDDRGECDLGTTRNHRMSPGRTCFSSPIRPSEFRLRSNWTVNGDRWVTDNELVRGKSRKDNATFDEIWQMLCFETLQEVGSYEVRYQAERVAIPSQNRSDYRHCQGSNLTTVPECSYFFFSYFNLLCPEVHHYHMSAKLRTNSSGVSVEMAAKMMCPFKYVTCTFENISFSRFCLFGYCDSTPYEIEEGSFGQAIWDADSISCRVKGEYLFERGETIHCPYEVWLYTFIAVVVASAFSLLFFFGVYRRRREWFRYLRMKMDRHQYQTLG